MSIYANWQYNQEIGKSKLTSSTAGVGSLITSKFGTTIMISDINKWNFVKKALSKIQFIREAEQKEEWYERTKKALYEDSGISIINDERFIDFLRIEKSLPNLLTLLQIPHISLNERFNSINSEDNPTIKKLKEKGMPVKGTDFTIPATHFPKWFINNSGHLKSIDQWKSIWDRNNTTKNSHFAPPRDANKPIKKHNKIVQITVKNDGKHEKINLYQELKQLNMVLICPRGHLSDIPWSKYLNWKSDTKKRKEDENATNLFNIDDCCNKPNLKWSENITKSEGYSSIYLECLHCGKGGGKNGQFKVNLEGINNIRPICKGQKPWEIDHKNENNFIPFEKCQSSANKNIPESMQVALVTGNNTYFSNIFSSIYIPKSLALNIPSYISDALEKLKQKLNMYINNFGEITKSDFAKQFMKDEQIQNDFQADVEKHPNFISEIREIFLKPVDEDNQEEDYHEFYRFQEYSAFSNNSEFRENGLVFNDIKLPLPLEPFFEKIQQIEEIKISKVQLDFSRVNPNERYKDENGQMQQLEGQNIFSQQPEEVLCLPAIESFGEGIFFKLNDDTINNWLSNYHDELTLRLKNISDVHVVGEMLSGMRQRILENGNKFFLIHTLAHIIMRELEFSSGYPTASLSERLYISERMSGFMIYTIEGNEGSMGGLIQQGLPNRIEILLKKALERLYNCSSDPLCWESDGQGMSNLNLAACFSCTLVSETSCEERNLGLDRRVLVDDELGFFKDLRK